MAVFGRDFYGLTKYGSNAHAVYDVSPFTAMSDDYNSVRVTWRSPAGSWQRLRLLKGRNGYAVDENDGTVLLDSETPGEYFQDQGLQGGAWYYYTIFVQDPTGVWNRAGATSALVVRKPWTRLNGEIVGSVYETHEVPYGHADLLWDRLPNYFRYVRPAGSAVTDEYRFAADPVAALHNPDFYDQENIDLRRFLGVLGFGLDYIHTYQETLLSANDPKKAHISDVDRLARTLGINFEYSIPAAVMRSKVANAALLARRRGTLDGLRDVASLTTGWDVDLQVNHNLFLNRDQSEFANPVFPEWDSGKNYAGGQKAQFEGRIFTAKAGGAYGDDQKPPYLGTDSNTWWQVSTNEDVTTLHNPVTDAVVTWKAFTDGAVPLTPNLAVGVSDPISGVGQESNALAIRNTDTAAHTYDLVGAANVAGSTAVLPDPNAAIRQGLPIPRGTLYDPKVEYALGALVQHRGALWRALGTPLGEEPDEASIFWEKVSPDNRPVMAYSFYGHGPLTGAAGSGGVAVNPGLAFFDERGNLLADWVNMSPVTAMVFDTFNHAFGTPDFTSTGSWSTSGAGWKTDSIGTKDNRVAYPVGPGMAWVNVPASLTQYRVAVTFTKAALGNLRDGMLLRYVDASNFMRVTRTSVEKVVNGTHTTVVALGTSIKDGDRVTAVIDDTTNTFQILINGAATASGPLTGGSAPFKHGIMVA